MKPKPVTLQIAMRQPGQDVDVLFPWTGYDFGVPGLAVAPAAAWGVGGKPKRRYRLWTIVHLPSGLVIGPDFSSRAIAAGLGLQLGELLSDWTHSDREILGNPDLVQAARLIVYGGVKS